MLSSPLGQKREFPTHANKCQHASSQVRKSSCASSPPQSTGPTQQKPEAGLCMITSYSAHLKQKLRIEEVQNRQQECLLGRRTAKSEAKAERAFALMTPAETTTSLYTTQSVDHGILSRLLIRLRPRTHSCKLKQPASVYLQYSQLCRYCLLPEPRRPVHLQRPQGGTQLALSGTVLPSSSKPSSLAVAK